MAETLARIPIQAAQPGETRRDFLYLTAAAVTAVSTTVAVWPLIDSMNPSAEVRALATVEIDLAPIQLGQRVTVIWRGKADDSADLRDPEPDSARVRRDEWLIVVGVCTHLGCIPKGQRSGDPVGRWGGWFCPCHGSHYDTSGRIRMGPAPKNLVVPPYGFLGDTLLHVGRVKS
jgi:ubiquinol-cytochrome c reductase iron-sulfur subunit